MEYFAKSTLRNITKKERKTVIRGEKRPENKD